MKTKLRHLLYWILTSINVFIPKKKKIAIYGGEFLDDNSEAMFRYLNDFSDYELVCICNKHLEYVIREKVRFVNNTYWNAFLQIASSRILIDSSFHTVKFKPSKKQMFIQCWHGSPLKSMVDPARNGIYYSKLFYASEIFKNYMSAYFHVDYSSMICLGAPRNDYLFSQKIFNYNCKEYSYFKYRVIWMPTFRQGLGREESNVDIPILNSHNIRELDRKLEKLNIALIIKPHRVQVGSFKHLFEKARLTNISVINEEYFITNNIPVYTFLSYMDAMITDYSSVYFDYLLLNRPIGFAIGDYEQYASNRGFAFDNPLEMMPGKKIFSFSDLIVFFEALVSEVDAFSDDRNRKKNLFNYYKDGNNCYRCKKLIDDFLNVIR